MRRLLVAVVALLWAACTGAVSDRERPRSGEASVTLYVVSHGWHVGVVLPRDGLPVEAWPESRLFPPVLFLEAGWGDRAFYQSPDAGIGLALKAAFASEASVLHVTGFDRAPTEAFPGAEIIAIELSPLGVASLARFVSQTYARDTEGKAIELGPGLYRGSRFYAATGRYSLLRTCNNWIAEALSAGGCPMSPAWAMSAGSVLRQAERCGRRIAR